MTNSFKVFLVNFYKLISFASFLLVVACSQSDDKKSGSDNKPAAPLEDQYGRNDEASCLYRPEAGYTQQTVDFKNDEIETASFGKNFRRNWLRPLLNTSGNETMALVPKAGVQVFKVKRPGDGCAFFANLPEAPYDLRSFWSQNDRSNGLLGLYLPYTPALQSTHSLPAIVVREKTDRHTLVHEFMHHNFSTKRLQETGITESALKADIKNSLNNLSVAQNKTSTKAESENLATMTIQFIKLFDELMVRYALEEATIESLLTQEYDNGHLRNTALASYFNGNSYVYSNGEKYLDTMREVQDLVSSIGSALYGYPDLKVKIQSAYDEIYSKRKAELQPMMDKARENLYRKGHYFSDGIYSSDSAVQHAGCSHSKETDEIRRDLRRHTARINAQNSTQIKLAN